MQVSKEIRARVVTELTRCIAVLEAKFVGHKFPMPIIQYTKGGTTAGTAQYSTWTINLNPGLLNDPRHTDEMINDTAPHELAHLVAFKVYPETMERGPLQRTRTGLKRGKREVHGPRWQYVMRVMGKNPERTHDMDTSNVSTRRTRYEWQCTGCNKVIELGPKHNKAQELRGTVFHKGCKGYKLIKPTAGATVKAAPVAAPVRPVAPAPLAPIRALTGTKLDKCKAIFYVQRNAARSDVINKFITLAGCTAAGAATYYASIKKAYEHAAD